MGIATRSGSGSGTLAAVSFSMLLPVFRLAMPFGSEARSISFQRKQDDDGPVTIRTQASLDASVPACYTKGLRKHLALYRYLLQYAVYKP
jgi:hypothetical protein